MVLLLALGAQAGPASAAPVNFDKARSQAAGDLPYSVETADLNGDGVLDIVTPNTLASNVSVLLGRGDGTFGAPATYATGERPRTVVTADFDEDGRVDLGVSNVFSGDVSVLKGDGRGGFGAPTHYAAGDQPRTLITRDLDRDGHADLAVVNRKDDSVSVFLGRGDGSMAPAIDYQAGNRRGDGREGDAYDLDSADFNRDGKLDLAVANRESNNLSLLLGQGDGTFTAGAIYPVGKTPFDVTVGDFDGDAEPDLAVGNLDSKDISILMGTGTGAFRTTARQGAGVAAFALAVADFNGDGRSDLAAANNTNTSYVDNKEYPGSASILLGRGDGGFGAPRNFGVGTRPVAIAGDDLDGDGRADLATANRESDDISVLLRSDTALSLSARPELVTWPATTALRGRLSAPGAEPLAGRRVTLYRRPWVRSAFTRVPGQPAAGVAVAADGTFRLPSVRPEWITDYQARFAGDSQGHAPVASALARVDQKVRVQLEVSGRDLKLGDTRTVSGAVSHASHAGLPVTVVIRRNGVVSEKKELTLGSDVGYRFSYRPTRPGQYTFVTRFHGHPPGHLGNTSARRGFRVVR